MALRVSADLVAGAVGPIRQAEQGDGAGGERTAIAESIARP